MKTKQKIRSFLLLEMMIAIFLVSISISPFLRSNLSFFRRELKQFECIEMQRIAELSLFEIKEKLYKNEIPWQDIPIQQTDAPLLKLQPFKTQIPGFATKDIERNYLLWGPEKEGTSNQIFKKVHILLTLHIPGHEHPSPRVRHLKEETPYQFHYKVFAQKLD